MDGNLTFNNNNLQTYNPATRVGIITNSIKHTDSPEKSMSLFSMADADGSVIPAINYPSKIVSIAGVIKGSSQSDLDARIDTFKGYFNGKDKNLDIAYGSGTRRYIATANTPQVERADKGWFATFAIDFTCTNPFGLDIAETNLWPAKTGFTAATFTETPTIEGSAPYQLPIFTITINSLTGDADFVQISNDDNSQEIIVFGQGLEAGDEVIIDCVEREVTINGLVAYNYGTFLELEPGPNSITYVDGFTTRNVDVSATYVKRWL